MRRGPLLTCFVLSLALAATALAQPGPADQAEEGSPSPALAVDPGGRRAVRGCPADADCVWAGDATVTLRVQPAAGPAEHLALHVSDASSHSATAGGLRLRLVRLDPEPRAGQSINREQYVVAISVTK